MVPESLNQIHNAAKRSADSCQLPRHQEIFPHRIERSCLPDFVTILQWKYMWSIDESERSDFFDFRNDTTKSAAQNFSILLTSVQCKQLQSHLFASLSAGGLESVKYWCTVKRLLVGITIIGTQGTGLKTSLPKSGENYRNTTTDNRQQLFRFLDVVGWRHMN